MSDTRRTHQKTADLIKLERFLWEVHEARPCSTAASLVDKARTEARAMAHSQDSNAANVGAMVLMYVGTSHNVVYDMARATLGLYPPHWHGHQVATAVAS